MKPDTLIKTDEAYAITLGHIVLFLSKSPMAGHVVIEVVDQGTLCAIDQIPIDEVRTVLDALE